MDQHTLMPRLSPSVARQRRAMMWERGEVIDFDRGALEEAVAAAGAFPSTGGTPVTVVELLQLRDTILDEVSAVPQQDMVEYDLALGRALFRASAGRRAEFAHPQVWDLLALLLLPDLATRRIWSSRSTPTLTSFQGRLTGGNRRHVMERLWKRWILFGPDIVESRRPKEDLYAVIFERPSLWQNPLLAQAVMEKLLAEGAVRGESTGDGYRDSIKPVRAATGFLDLTIDDEDYLRSVVDHQYREYLESRGRDAKEEISSARTAHVLTREAGDPAEAAPRPAPEPTARRRPISLRRIFGGK